MKRQLFLLRHPYSAKSANANARTWNQHQIASFIKKTATAVASSSLFAPMMASCILNNNRSNYTSSKFHQCSISNCNYNNAFTQHEQKRHLASSTSKKTKNKKKRSNGGHNHSHSYQGKNNNKNKKKESALPPPPASANANTNRHRQRRPPRLKKDTTSPKEAPPLFLYPTASPHVYISSIAIHSMNEHPEAGNDDEVHEHVYEQEQQQESIHPKSFFTETSIPYLFRNSRFEYVSPKQFKHELPTNQSVPEVAFLGRSNVGKSSLLNAITGNPQLARISKTPGRTQQVNYFGQFINSGGGSGNDSNGVIGATIGSGGRSSGDKEVRDVISNPPFGYIIDLPGYGYAQAPDELVDEWQKNTQDFIVARKEFGTLERLYMLVDSKRGIGIIDSTIMSWLDEANVNYTVVLTKSDSSTKPLIVKGANEICMRYHNQVSDNERSGAVVGCQSPFVHVTSSRKGIGVVDLMYAIEADFHGFRLNEA